jgi:dihydroorotate dehydrogenase electron transfer subunit
MVSNFSSTTPVLNADGTISAIIRDAQAIAPAGLLLRVWLPVAYHAGGGFGRFFLARCAEDTTEARRNDWSIYNRRALFCAGIPQAMPDQAGSTWDLLIPASDDPGHRWLTQRSLDSAINLLGPFGHPFELPAHARALLVLADTQTLPLMLPVIHTMLDRGGRVTLLIQGDTDTASPLLSLVPIPVEVRIIDVTNWLAQLNEPIRWADQLCAALPNQQYPELAHQIRSVRFQSDTAFAQVLVASDLLCGVGACLACVVSTRDGGFTRACMHGPVFPLASITA